MAKRKDIDGKSATLIGDAATTEASTIETKSTESVGDAPKDDAPKVDTPEATAAPAELVKDELPIIEAPKLAAEAPQLTAEAPKFAEVKAVAEADRAAPSLPPPAVEAPAAPVSPAASVRINRFALLAASVAIAAAIGAMGGALGASGLMRSAEVEVAEAAPMPTIVDETRAVQTALTQLRADLAALKTSIDAGAKSANGQFAKITERFDRVERAQSEPNAKMTKAIEAVERLEKRVDAAATRDVTGSVTPPQPAAANASAPPQQTSIVEGWVVRDVYRGAAMIQGRRFGVIEVETGDIIPGIGRVEAIRKQDGRWVVVTPKGLIASPR
jgi:hypothetical protein